MCEVPRTSCIFLNKHVFFLHFYKHSSSWKSLCSLYFKSYVLVVYLICPLSSSYLLHLRNIVGQSIMYIFIMVKVKTSLLQAVEAPRVARGQGSHIN
jgi:hypothetical protein